MRFRLTIPAVPRPGVAAAASGGSEGPRDFVEKAEAGAARVAEGWEAAVVVKETAAAGVEQVEEDLD